MREGFEIGTWHKIIGGKCDEEVVRYMEFTLESWVKLWALKKLYSMSTLRMSKSFSSGFRGSRKLIIVTSPIWLKVA
ncbi:hypothetical protein FocnCong_v021670 [Fusarium oxysporum f. sp. conglutinans]|nr:hypothetical protein FocnCong_v021670 [Fusarium oxysporum f. sp. conglutinans]